MGVICNCLKFKDNINKLVLISCKERNMLELRWTGKVVNHEEIFCHLGSPIGVDVSRVKVVDWAST